MTTDEAYLEHIGILRRSGRYPWGSGETPYQRSRDFKATIADLKSQGMSDHDIRAMFPDERGNPMSTTDYRAAVAHSTAQIRAANVSRADHLVNELGMSASAAAREMGTNESTVRTWLKTTQQINDKSIEATSNVLKEALKEKPFLDVGKGNELFMGISSVKLNTALSGLKDEGYQVHSGIKVPQLGTGKMTEFKVLTNPGVSWKEAKDAVLQGRLQLITEHSDNGGLSYKVPDHNPVSISSKRIDVRYGPDGGAKMDGVIELRRGVPELDLGGKRYAQVRVAVDGTHYLKGMAMYADDLPAGVDIRFNTNKTKAEAPKKTDAMKPLTDDPANRFGATTHPKVYIDKKTGKEKTSALNVVYEEGRWDEWSRTLSSQMLSKQSVKLANEQLGKTRASKQKELNEILALTNPVVKKKLLEEFADSADAAASHLKAAKLPDQSSHVILPMNSMRPNEIYAPNFTTGQKVVLIRYPHGGPFEIPELTVNNNNLKAKRILQDAKDAVGIHHSVAEQLSGADFDGDSVVVIPNPTGKVKSRPPLQALKNFEPKVQYKIPDDDKTITRMTKKNTQTEMGKISNLITDMTIKGATEAELARAVRHSMVVIDAEKHGLNYKQSEADHAIKQLKTKYQGGPTKGAATIISRASADARVPERKYLTGTRGIDPKTGEKVFVETGATRTRPVTKTNKRTGEVTTTLVTEKKTTKGSKMDFAKDAAELLSDRDSKGARIKGVSPEPMERVYADHANSMKAMANRARKETLALQMPKMSSAAKRLYAKEVESLNAKLQAAERNAPIERRAQVIGNARAKARIDSNPHLEKDDIIRLKHQELEQARLITGAAKKKIGTDETPLTAREWQAIQAGAISYTKLAAILRNANMERIKELATPRQRTALTPGQLARAKQMQASGRPMSEIVEALGLPRSTIADNLENA